MGRVQLGGRKGEVNVIQATGPGLLAMVFRVLALGLGLRVG